MGRHSLWHMDMVSVAIVGMHSMRVLRWTLVCSSAMQLKKGGLDNST